MSGWAAGWIDGKAASHAQRVFWADGVITAVSLVWTAYYLGDIYDGLSFGGFFALFLLLILFPYFLAMGAALFAPLDVRQNRQAGAGRNRRRGAASVPHPLALAQLRDGVHTPPPLR